MKNVSDDFVKQKYREKIFKNVTQQQNSLEISFILCYFLSKNKADVALYMKKLNN